MKCISCGFNNISSFLKIPNAPIRVQVIPRKLIAKDKKINIEILKCSKCTLVQLSNKNYVVDDYYDDYIMSRTYSNYSKKYLQWLARDFISQFDLKNKSIVDVGCGDGYFVKCLNEQKSKAFGIEPSDVACNLAKKRGVKVIRDYVDDKFRLNKKVDAFVTLEVFEHISNPKKLLKNVKKFLNVGAYGMVEVPSLVKALRDNRYYDFFPDHVAYYSPTSLSYMLQLNGFDVISVKHTGTDDYITAYFVYAENSGVPDNIQPRFVNYKSEYIRFFSKLKGKKVALWGAGAKGITSISFSNIPKENVLFCVDSDPNKLGTFFPGSHIPVKSPKELFKTNVDVVVVTAMAYTDEIVDTLRKKYKFKNNQIAIIAPTPSFLA